MSMRLFSLSENTGSVLGPVLNYLKGLLFQGFQTSTKSSPRSSNVGYRADALHTLIPEGLQDEMSSFRNLRQVTWEDVFRGALENSVLMLKHTIFIQNLNVQT